MSILRELTNAQRAEIKQQLRAIPKRLSEITVTGLDLHNNPWHREMRDRYVHELAEKGEARMVTATPLPDHHGRQNQRRQRDSGLQTMGKLSPIPQRYGPIARGRGHKLTNPTLNRRHIMSKDQPKPLSSPNTLGGSSPRRPTQAQTRAILAAYFGKGPNAQGEFAPLHPHAIQDVPGLSSLDPADRGQVHDWAIDLERSGFLSQTRAHGRTPGPLIINEKGVALFQQLNKKAEAGQ